jgi:hypothetical protein
VTYDNGNPDTIDIRQNIAQGGESRVIDLNGIGKRSIRRQGVCGKGPVGPLTVSTN